MELDTTEQSAVATLRDLLPEIEGEDAPVGCTELLIALGVEKDLAWSWLEDRSHPLIDLTAADDLVTECGYVRQSGHSVSKDGFEAYVFKWPKSDPIIFQSAMHPTDERRAILAALVRARIATLEGEHG